MGTNSKTNHQSYALAPTAAPAGGPQQVPGADLEPLVLALLDQPLGVEGPAGDSATVDVQSADDTTVEEPLAANTVPDGANSADPVAAVEHPGPATIAPVSDLVEALTPVPDTPEPGLATGQPVLVGGEDLESSTATLISYLDPHGPRTVLHAMVTPDAEDKLMDALHLSDTKMIPVESEQLVHKRLALDTDHGVFDALVCAAKSVNHHVNNKNLTEGKIPDTTAAKLSKAHAAVEVMVTAAGTDTTSTTQEMLAHYQQQLAAIDAAAAAGKPVDHVTASLHEATETVTHYIPAPADTPPDGRLPAAQRDATRIKPTIDPTTGQTSWDGLARHNQVHGKEYVIDLGDGYSAVYRPHNATKGSTEFSLRGRLELIAPPGEGHGPELVRRLGDLHLTNRPMTHAEGEWTYLTANVTAQDLGGKPEVAQAVTVGQHLEDMVRQELFHERAHQAVGMDSDQLRVFAKSIQLEAATRALPAKVGVLRDAVATATGHTTGTELAATPGYDPTPRTSGGWLTWSRFDVGNQLPKLTQKLQGKALTHTLHGGSLAKMLRTGVLASTERRTLMGIASGVGMSESADKNSGGAKSVFLRIRPVSETASGPRLVWDHPERLLARADYYGVNSDTFGAINPADHHYTTKSTRDPYKIATFTNPSNEIMFADGIDLLGPEGPSRIICAHAGERDEIRAMLTAKGVSTIAGKPIHDVVISK